MVVLGWVWAVVTKFDSNLSRPDSEVIEKRLHSVLVVSALLLTATMGLMDMVTENELYLRLRNTTELLQEMTELTARRDWYFNCFFLSHACVVEVDARKALQDSSLLGVSDPITRLRDDFLEMSSYSIHFSMVGLLISLLCYLSLNHVNQHGRALKFWYRTHVLLMVIAYVVTGAGAIAMTFAFDSLCFLKGGLTLYLQVLQRTYIVGYVSMCLGLYFLVCMVTANSIGSDGDDEYYSSLGRGTSAKYHRRQDRKGSSMMLGPGLITIPSSPKMWDKGEKNRRRKSNSSLPEKGPAAVTPVATNHEAKNILDGEEEEEEKKHTDKPETVKRENTFDAFQREVEMLMEDEE